MTTVHRSHYCGYAGACMKMTLKLTARHFRGYPLMLTVTDIAMHVCASSINQMHIVSHAHSSQRSCHVSTSATMM